MGSNDEFIIPFEGLKYGKHIYNLNVTDEFFALREYSLIEKGNVKVTFELDKRETMMVGDFHFEGGLITECDRCLEPLELPIVSSHQIIFKFDDEPSDDENLICIGSTEFTIDISDLCYELITIAMPMRKVHDYCEDDEFEWLDEDQEEEEIEEQEDTTSSDPRWNALKKLKDNLD